MVGDSLLDDFMVRAFCAGAAVALAAGPLGCLVVWRRMSYFGDTIAHGALPGVALGIAAGFNPTAGVLGVGVVVALMVVAFRRWWLDGAPGLGFALPRRRPVRD